jgi:hypothetical protein
MDFSSSEKRARFLCTLASTRMRKMVRTELGRRLAALDRGDAVEPAEARARLKPKSGQRRKPQARAPTFSAPMPPLSAPSCLPPSDPLCVTACPPTPPCSPSVPPAAFLHRPEPGMPARVLLPRRRALLRLSPMVCCRMLPQGNTGCRNRSIGKTRTSASTRRSPSFTPRGRPGTTPTFIIFWPRGPSIPAAPS